MSKPDIEALSVKRLELETDSNKVVERLSIFLLFKDKNGREDYNSLTIIHKESGLSWTLNRNNTSFFSSQAYDKDEKEKKLWAGSNKFAYPMGRIPLGDYSLIIEDLAGNRSFKSFSLKGEIQNSDVPFEFAITNDSWKIQNKNEKTFNNYSLILLGADKQPIFVKELGQINSSEMTGKLEKLKDEYSDARYIQCLGENHQKTIGYLTKSYKLY